MSILLITAQATAPSGFERFIGDARVFGLLLLIAAMLAWGVGLFRRDGIVGRARLEPSEPVVPLLLITVIGGLTWLGSQVAFGIVKGLQWHRDHPNEEFQIDKLAAGELAFLAIVPAGIAFVVLTVGDIAARRDLPRRLGYALRMLPMGVLIGFLAIFIVLPVMWGFSAILELIYRRFGIEHPSSHELLRAMKEAPPAVRMLLIGGACVMAPVFEELLFRGHIQTVLLRLFTRGSPRYCPVCGQEALNEACSHCLMSRSGSKSRPVIMTWLAVIITSILFAAVHPLWMAPLIFILSISLGFAYERTGNLWTAITIHALFNTSSTLIYLNLT